LLCRLSSTIFKKRALTPTIISLSIITIRFLLYLWQNHLPAEFNSPTTTIIVRATYRLTLCTTISRSMITFLLKRQNNNAAFWKHITT
jgi:hypothetical protein